MGDPGFGFMMGQENWVLWDEIGAFIWGIMDFSKASRFCIERRNLYTMMNSRTGPCLETFHRPKRGSVECGIQKWLAPGQLTGI